ncbi:hypothetical protein BRO54_3576 [Geobacillus proteiniphilus]|uniref:Uncharacterized protein n=1 Tax=Geobacillus proteiniphilus TaxID=860353 RepID=A0A1Q5SLA5_9BACL|nr:hypothetical protein BRO54_3576 [Geobacillus proteiniphilus]
MFVSVKKTMKPFKTLRSLIFLNPWGMGFWPAWWEPPSMNRSLVVLCVSLG